MTDRRTAADRAERQAVDFVGGADFTATMTNRDISQYARVVVVVAATIQAARFFRRYAFDGVFTSSRAGIRSAKDDYSAPQTAADAKSRVQRNVTWIIHIVENRREDNRFGRGAFGINAATARHNKSRCIRAESRVSFDNRSRLDNKDFAIFHKDEFL